MVNHKESISSYQASAIISNTTLGASMLVLPRSMAQAASTPDGWIALLLMSVIYIVFIFANVLMMKKVPFSSYYDYTNEGLGKWIGTIANLLIIIYFLGVASYEVRSMSEMVKFFLLQNTPIAVTMLSFILVGFYLVIGGIGDFARLCPFFLIVTLIILFVAYGLSVQEFELDNLRPVLGEGFSPVFQSFNASAISFVGIEMMLFMPAYMKSQKHTFAYGAVGFLIPAIIYIFTYILVVGALTVKETATLTWPTIALFQSFDIQGIFIERIESFLLIVWLVQLYTSFVGYTFFAAMGVSKLTKFPKKVVLGLMAVVIYLAAIFPKDVDTVRVYLAYVNNLFFLLFGILPFLLFIIVFFKRRRKAA
ncbi:spore gernimation protein [Bacillus xiamenensis]|uniref:Spore gernimation protein n=1 Tax=Bacillus xiamenensis TaxID=1178537 RepID=A0AAC9ILZ3_9BACI|nr:MULTISPECIES: GerAB/ArcD/ProY family transporter [Bacillus]AOZ89389.1 spore gernimation protein [Bacillus xiamenensis]EKF36365.1 spore germination protein AB [Bacillus xiamenensis]MCW1835297.1 spore germination protein [Bacillus xiamenensis]QGX64778.1 GerAB/ArcD/ProY family transporter [Bacillus sp. ms-22]